MKNKQYIKIAFLFSIAIFTGCELDQRLDDLTGGYEGAFIDKNTNDVVYTEFYGAKLRLLDLAYGDVAQPLDYFALPDGTFNNTKIFPATYKIWADGPFLELDTIQSKNLSSKEAFDIQVIPNVSLTLESLESFYGIGMKATYTYSVNDPLSTEQEIGLVYSDLNYPGFKNAGFADNSSALVTKKIHTLTDLTGTIIDSVYLSPNTDFYVRALGRINGSDYWNYSNQETLAISDLDVNAIPLSIEVGARSNSSAVLAIPLPPLDGLSFKIEYTDKDGNDIVDLLSGLDYAYVSNLTESATTSISVSLTDGINTGDPVVVSATTKAIGDLYLDTECARPANIPLYYSEDMQYSISDWQVQNNIGEPGFYEAPDRYTYIFLWGTWACTWLPGFADNLPTCQEMAAATELTLFGNISTLVDILPFTSLETLTIRVEDGGTNYSSGGVVSKFINLEPLTKLPSLTTVILGAGVPLTEADFVAAGVTGLTIVKN